MKVQGKFTNTQLPYNVKTYRHNGNFSLNQH